MAQKSSFLHSLRVFFGFLYTSRRKPRPPSPTTSIIFPGPSVRDELSSNESVCGFVVNFNRDVWEEIFSYLEVIDILRVGMTCRSLASVTEGHCVWHSALRRISYDRRLPHLRSHIKSLPEAALRQKAILLTQLDYLPYGVDHISSRYKTTCFSLPFSVVRGISFLPGGEWLVVLCRKAGEDGVMFCKANNPSGQPSRYSSVPGGHLIGMRIFTSDDGDLLMMLRSQHHDETMLGVYLVYPLESYPPRLERIWTMTIWNMENFTALGSYVAYGWIDYSQIEPRHLIRVLKFESSCRKFIDYNTIKVVWDIAKYSRSYELRIAGAQIMVVVSSTSLIAAYKVPTMASASIPDEPITVEPFWHFPCDHIRPRAVYLVASLPAVNVPSIAIFYGDRCLFITPSFDADPPGVHPTYFATFKCPRALKRPLILGPQRAFWDLGRGRVGIGPLPTPLQPGFHEHGSWDITGVNTLEADLGDYVHPFVHAEPYDRRVARAAWDEESGKLALFPKAELQRGENSVVVVDFMH